MKLPPIAIGLTYLFLSSLTYGQVTGVEEIGPFGGLDQTNTKFVILLGPDLKPGQKPFLDPYEMSQQLPGNLQVPVESVSVDLTTPLPTKPGVTVQVKHPRVLPEGEDVNELTDRIRREAIRFGISDVELSAEEAEKRVSKRVRVGLPSGQANQVDLRKYAYAAAVLDPQDPTVELFDERPLHAAGDGMFSLMSGMRGIGGMGGMGIGSGGYDPMVLAHAPRQAPAEGTVQSGSLVVSWSIEKSYASAIGTQTGTGWIRIELEGKRMTTPVVGDAACAFYCDNKAYAFSGILGRWDVLKIQSLPEPPPAIVVDMHTATIRTADDIHIFTAASGRWSSRSQSGNAYSRKDGEPLAPLAGGMREGNSFGGMRPAQASDRTAVDANGIQTKSLLPSSTTSGGIAILGATGDLSVGELTTHVRNLRSARDRAEAETARLAGQYKQASDTTQKLEISKQLSTAASTEFQVNTDLQMMEARLLAKKFGLIEEQFRRRERHRDELIRQRIDRLLVK